MIAPVVRIEELATTVIAYGDIGADRRGASCLNDALHDDELTLASKRKLGGVNGIHLRERRRRRSKPGDELVNGRGGTFRLDEDTATVVPDETHESQLVGDGVDERSEPDPLNDTADPQSSTNGRWIARPRHR